MLLILQKVPAPGARRRKMHPELLQTLIETLPPQEQERSRRLRGVLTELSLRDENALFELSRGVSQNNAHLGFVPAYLNTATGEQVRARFADGSPAPVHLLDGLPETWVSARDSEGHVTRTCSGLISGFIRDGRFYTRDEASRAAAH
jgi:hypothetical protein